MSPPTLILLFVLNLFILATFGKITWQTQKNVNLDKISVNEFREVFNQWKKDFNINYETKKQDDDALKIFIINFKYIVEWNKKSHSYTMKLNQFAAMTPKEFASMLNKNSEVRNFKQYKTKLRIRRIARLIDWTKRGVVPPVQERSAECSPIFPVTAVITCRNAISRKQHSIQLSRQQLIDCSVGNGGFINDAYKFVELNGGLCSEKDYPFTGRVGKCHNCTKLYGPISGYIDVQENNRHSLEVALSTGCVQVAVSASKFQFYSSGIFTTNCGIQLDHTMLLVGIGKTKLNHYWKLQNNWGTTWGEDGYIRLCKNCNKNDGAGQCGILMEAGYPVTPIP